MEINFNSFGKIPRSMIAGSYGRSMFSFMRNCLSSKSERSGCTVFAFQQQRIRVPVDLHSCHWVLSVFWILAILMDA